MGAIPRERVLDERGPRRAGTCTRPPAFGPWRANPGVRPRYANLGVRTRFASCAHAAVALPERRMPGNLREGPMLVD